MKSDRKFDTISQTLIIYKLPVTIGTGTGNYKRSDYVAFIKQGASAPNLQYKRRNLIASRVGQRRVRRELIILVQEY